MPASDAQLAKRALVKVLLTIALLYSLRLEVTRDSSDDAVNKAFQQRCKAGLHRWTGVENYAPFLT